MVQKRNLTIQLDSDTIRKARVLAAQRSTSVSRLVAEEIERLVGEDEAYRKARDEAIAELMEGYDLGGGPLPTREELYDR